MNPNDEIYRFFFFCCKYEILYWKRYHLNCFSNCKYKWCFTTRNYIILKVWESIKLEKAKVVCTYIIYGILWNCYSNPLFVILNPMYSFFLSILLLKVIKGLKVYALQLNWGECFKIFDNNKYVYAIYLPECDWIFIILLVIMWMYDIYLAWNGINKMTMNC